MACSRYHIFPDSTPNPSVDLLLTAAFTGIGFPPLRSLKALSVYTVKNSVLRPSRRTRPAVAGAVWITPRETGERSREKVGGSEPEGEPARHRDRLRRSAGVRLQMLENLLHHPAVQARDEFQRVAAVGTVFQIELEQFPSPVTALTMPEPSSSTPLQHTPKLITMKLES